MKLSQALDLLIYNEEVSHQTINMVPSENYASVLSRIPLLLDVYNRYFFNVEQDEDHWNFRGAQNVADLESKLAISLLKELTTAKHVNLRPISGLNCMALVLNALGKNTGNNIMIVSPEQGGHYATQQLAESFGLNVTLITGVDAHTIDFDDLAYKLSMEKIDLIYIDQSNCLFPIDVKDLVQTVRKVSPETIVHIDVSHWMGLILGKSMPNPLDEGADSFGGSTHKTFPGPQKAIFCTNRSDLAKLVSEAQYYMLSSHHFGGVLSLALALLEFKECNGTHYAQQVIANSKKLAANLNQYGFDVKGASKGFTCGHQIWMSTNNTGVDSFEASKRLYNVGIRVNVFDNLPGAPESILRLGVNEITRFGASISDMDELSQIMYDAISNNGSPEEIKSRVNKLRNQYKNAYSYDINSSELKDRINKIITLLFPVRNREEITI
ncbi:aminotransferase class V-fold PLP-dependent enzyme [Bacillus cereus]|uniref:aminotransferase class V-fold PLP-dependent enzyme n=1 Tax=Bacillus cereus group TaxID=86661 RepID=UPI00080F6329|nr:MULTISPECIES: aminotransferase class V-fold PLP-dependent enzyme [Bacillus cereus group]ANV74419.1 hypothetical protein BCM43_28665 [Bacillus thuringiensis]MCU7756573.1 aminotransferase class V-fold PLP-dependent enzyme [Bacillus cereus]MDA2490047.1 aminotransferase class V-fold PLP-dependent enzyme [Bacillus cereus]MDA2626413.1 aminotransferase class V-fold PLP-dependent enzyme [Bacillus cereus]MDC7752628.1 aminotransferase class V-fold PLP-dependent enzyme [Bacillus cereus]